MIAHTHKHFYCALCIMQQLRYFIARVVAGVQEEFEIVQAIVQGLGLGLGWRLGLETNHVPVCKT